MNTPENCWYCGVKLAKPSGTDNSEIRRWATRDHIVPLSRGGTDDESNIVWACQSCNCQKHNRTLEGYRQYRYQISPAGVAKAGLLAALSSGAITSDEISNGIVLAVTYLDQFCPPPKFWGEQ